MRLFLLVVLCCLSAPAFTCRVREVPAAEQIAQSDAVYLGVVTGMSLPDLEQTINATRKSAITIGGSVAGRISIFATLRGPEQTVVEANLPTCGPYLPELRQVVVVLHSAAGYSVSSDPDLVRAVQKKLGGA